MLLILCIISIVSAQLNDADLKYNESQCYSHRDANYTERWWNKPKPDWRQVSQNTSCGHQDSSKCVPCTSIIKLYKCYQPHNNGTFLSGEKQREPSRYDSNYKRTNHTPKDCSCFKVNGTYYIGEQPLKNARNTSTKCSLPTCNQCPYTRTAWKETFNNFSCYQY